MSELASWDWDTKEKLIADIHEWKKKSIDLRELTPSDDGEKIAAIVQPESGKFTTCVNGEVWEEKFERQYSLKFNADNQLFTLGYRNFEWLITTDQNVSENTFELIWNLTITPDGKGFAANIKQEEGKLGVYLNGQAWENMFSDARSVAISPDGKRTASCVQVEPLVGADIFKYLKGIRTVAVDGTPWEKAFLTVWGAVFSPDSNHVAAVVRTGMAQYNIAVDGKTWEGPYGLAWEPIFKPNSNDVVAPVRTPKGTTLALNGKPIWGFFFNAWRQKFSSDGQKIAAVVCSPFPLWTVAVDGTPWKTQFTDAVLTPVFSPDGRKVAAVVKSHNTWTVAVDGSPWTDTFENVWDPIFIPGNRVLAKAEKSGKYYIAIDGKMGKKGYESLWNPVLSPDGHKLLIRCIDGGKYYRRVIPINEI